KFREKRKWQIALRRYVLEKSPCAAYAPYFGLDIENMRRWFEYQFKEGASWENFGEKWQFEHIVPVTYFDFALEEDLMICWNFVNIRVEFIDENKERGARPDLLVARNYFKDLLDKTQYPVCRDLLNKIDQIEQTETINTGAQATFIRENADYLTLLEGYSSFEFEMLNSGRSLEDVRKESEFLKNFEK
ncbi:MAG TPA: hypothetical protein PLL23_08485, partial [Chitinophagaceae bacterium]|nr:hypothetical protein [Chitinophagaceae bacterium]